MKGEYFKEVSRLTPTRFWINNVTVQEARWALEAGAVGCTQNPSYAWKILDGSDDSGYARELLQRKGTTPKRVPYSSGNWSGG